MTRLTRSFHAYVRKMQMSRTTAFIFVEGQRNDVYFYGEICQIVAAEISYTYDVRMARELPGDAGGKSSLLKFFKYCRRRSVLKDSFQGKKTVVLFYLDKDIDDLTGRTIHSDHVVYTKYYDVENHIFVHGNLSRGIAATASIEYQKVLHKVGDEELWRANVAAKWKDWVKLCIFTQKQRISFESNYGVNSRINSPTCGPIDHTLYAQCLANLEARLRHSRKGFKISYGKVSKLVDRLYTEGKHDFVFKGKWYLIFLEEEIKTIAGGRSIDSRAISSRLISTIVTTVDFSQEWSIHFTRPLSKVLQDL